MKLSSSSEQKKDRFVDLFPRIDAWDKHWIQSIYHRYEGTTMRKLAPIISFFGDPKLWLPVLVIFFIVGLVSQNFTYFVIFATGFFQSYVIYYIIKHVINRPRPFLQFEKVERLDKTGHGYSFPSGHAHHSTLLMGLFWLIFFPNPWVILGLIAYNLCVGYSRIISGVHFPSDTIFGIFEGYLMLCLHWLVTKDMYIFIIHEITTTLCSAVNLCFVILP